MIWTQRHHWAVGLYERPLANSTEEVVLEVRTVLWPQLISEILPWLRHCRRNSSLRHWWSSCLRSTPMIIYYELDALYLCLLGRNMSIADQFVQCRLQYFFGYVEIASHFLLYSSSIACHVLRCVFTIQRVSVIQWRFLLTSFRISFDS